MTIGNMKISHQMEFATPNIKFRMTLELESNDTLDICDFWMHSGDANYAQSSRPDRNDEQRRCSRDMKDLLCSDGVHQLIFRTCLTQLIPQNFLALA